MCDSATGQLHPLQHQLHGVEDVDCKLLLFLLFFDRRKSAHTGPVWDRQCVPLGHDNWFGLCLGARFLSWPRNGFGLCFLVSVLLLSLFRMEEMLSTVTGRGGKGDQKASKNMRVCVLLVSSITQATALGLAGQLCSHGPDIF